LNASGFLERGPSKEISSMFAKAVFIEPDSKDRIMWKKENSVAVTTILPGGKSQARPGRPQLIYF
jgi:hypothetical protein